MQVASSTVQTTVRVAGWRTCSAYTRRERAQNTGSAASADTRPTRSSAKPAEARLAGYARGRKDAQSQFTHEYAFVVIEDDAYSGCLNAYTAASL